MVYINSLPEKIENITYLFADDSKIISVLKEQTDVDMLQKNLDVAGDWCTTWVMRWINSR